MADRTRIEWADATWNPITGCQIVSEGCRNCYAMQLAGTRLAHTQSRAGLTRKNAQGKHVWTGETRFNAEMLDEPLRWKAPRRIFVCAHGDLFAESVPEDWIDKVFAIMALAPHHTFQVLTKRPERMRGYLTTLLDEFGSMVGWTVRFRDAARKAGALLGDMTALRATTWPLPNVWLGVSVEDQATADARIPLLLSTPAAIRWISAEPLLGPVDLTNIQMVTSPDTGAVPCQINSLSGTWTRGGVPHDPVGRLDWVVVGGESGPGARPMHPHWARSLRDQCAAAGVPFFFKQWGNWMHESQFHDYAGDTLRDFTLSRVGRGKRPARHTWADGTLSAHLSRDLDPKTLDGITHHAWPEVA